MREYAEKTVGPTMLNYVEWVLDEAGRRNIERLYFLARDGYLLCEIAKKIVKRRGLPIECRYLYCSRQALRIPSYAVIGKEAFELLTLGGYYLTPRSVISRAAIGRENEDVILNSLGISEPDKPFIKNEFQDFAKRLRESLQYQALVKEVSEAAYGNAIDYFRQEGLFDREYVAVVDSGWTGSMQRSLRQLLESAGYEGRLYGFYFGMFREPKDEKDGEYLNFYFDHNSGFLRKLNFNNNLFECMLSATHPMTVGYEAEDGRLRPVFAKGHGEELLPIIEAQIAGALAYTDRALEEGLAPFNVKRARKLCYKILKRAMVYPTRDEVELLSSFMFCDDVTEGYRNSLADATMREKLANYSFFKRLWRKLTGRKNSGGNEIFWVYGVIALCPPLTRPWKRLNVRLWEIARIILKK